jgi:DNA-binding MarR family transcriptional regulator
MKDRTVCLVQRMATEVEIGMANAMTDIDITPHQYSVMSFMDKENGKFSAAQLSRHFLITPQSMNTLVQTLMRKEFIEKINDPHNKRVRLLVLTDKGKKILAASNAAIDKSELELFKSLSDLELKIYRDLTEKLLNSML